jgi:hypothetical protein
MWEDSIGPRPTPVRKILGKVGQKHIWNTARERATSKSQVDDGELGGAVSARRWCTMEAGEHEEKIL